MADERVLAGIPVADHDAATAWYTQFFGRDADLAPMPGLAEWHCTPLGGVQIFHDPEHAGGATLTLGVPDLNGYLAALRGRGIAVGAVTSGAISRFAPVTDPEGNTMMIAELYDKPA